MIRALFGGKKPTAEAGSDRHQERRINSLDATRRAILLCWYLNPAGAIPSTSDPSRLQVLEEELITATTEARQLLPKGKTVYLPGGGGIFRFSYNPGNRHFSLFAGGFSDIGRRCYKATFVANDSEPVRLWRRGESEPEEVPWDEILQATDPIIPDFLRPPD